MKYFLKKLTEKGKLNKIIYERFTEPAHLNFISLFVTLLGSFEKKVEFDLILRQHYAFCILGAARLARNLGFKSTTLIEFGTGSGMGLMNICEIAKKVSKCTGVHLDIVGFDLGTGLPKPRDYRDHPEIFSPGSYPLLDKDRLLESLPDNARLILGDIADTVPGFIKTISKESPIGFVAIDVDYYSSAKESLKVFEGNPELYLPFLLVYLDDVGDFINYSPWTGELLAVNEFNTENKLRKISFYSGLRGKRIFKNANWINKIYVMHVLDHTWRSVNNTGNKVFEKNLYF